MLFCCFFFDHVSYLSSPLCYQHFCAPNQNLSRLPWWEKNKQKKKLTLSCFQLYETDITAVWILNVHSVKLLYFMFKSAERDVAHLKLLCNLGSIQEEPGVETVHWAKGRWEERNGWNSRLSTCAAARIRLSHRCVKAHTFKHCTNMWKQQRPPRTFTGKRGLI